MRWHALPAQRRWTTAASTEPHQADGRGGVQTGHPSSSVKEVKYTREMYPSLTRNPQFAQLSAADVQYFQTTLVDASAVIDGVTRDAHDDTDAFNIDWMRKYRGQSQLVLRPKSTAEVSQILAYCHARGLAVVPQGGNSGLVGGSVPVFDEIVLQLSRLKQIRSFDAVSGTLVCEAGCILEVADGYLAERGHIFPLDLGAKGSCQIGGNVATNAGGLRLLRYGSLHGNVLGLEAVLADGTVMEDLWQLRKNNTGYDLKQLFIGGEGTLGVITAVSILCPPRPRAVNVAFFACASFEQVQATYREAKAQLAEILSAFELMDARSQHLVQHVTGKTRPLDDPDHPFYCLVETSGSNKEHDDEKLERFLEQVLDAGIVTDGVLAQDTTQMANLWSWRERIPECLSHWGGLYKYDISLPIGTMYDLVEETRRHLIDAKLLHPDPNPDRYGAADAAADAAADVYPVVDVIGFGHMGDANLHLNICTRGFEPRIEAALEPFVFERCRHYHGSISAEHGLGLAKRAFVGYSRNETMLRLMRDLKRLYDPKGIMNPYKYV
ncbi:MAG: hypothetical protein M1826_002730 [Phylliscum demangeonii]|nr:MAG: hypothetical protein M1826_002730 [Phylliscum demangeonii]